MATTVEGALASGEQVRWRFYLTVDGVPHAFGMSTADTAVFETETGRIHKACIRDLPQFSGDSLSYANRTVVGGTVSVEVLDDDALALQAFFAPRKRRATWVTAAHTAATTTLTVDDSAAVGTLPVDLWVGGETMRATAAPTATTLTVVRAKYGSPAQKHRGATEQGASVHVVPRRWKGRRVRVWGYLVDSQGQATTGRRLQFGVWRLRSAPTFLGPRRWRIEGDPLIDDFATRKLGEGLFDSASNSASCSQHGSTRHKRIRFF